LWCPYCGQEILESIPKFCPRCGRTIETRIPDEGTTETFDEAANPSSLEPFPQQDEQPVLETTSSTLSEVQPQDVSAGWYLLPVFFAVIGGLVGYFSVKERNPKVAKRLLYVGGTFTVVYLVSFAAIDLYVVGGILAPFQPSSGQRTSPDGGTGLYIVHVQFINGTITLPIQNYAHSNSQIGRILVDNRTGSQTFDAKTALYAVYGWTCAPISPCASATASSYGFLFTGYIYANNTKIELYPNTSFYSLPVGPYPSTITVTLPYHYVSGHRYYVFIQDQNDNTVEGAYNIPA
jgi:hypothetical protein